MRTTKLIMGNLTAGLAIVLLASCGSSVSGGGGGASSVCTPGDTKTCVGPGACQGGQACEASGAAWGACNCGAGGGSSSSSSSTTSSSGAGGGCAPGMVDCDGNSANGCETNTQTNLGNCGNCGSKCDSTNGAASCNLGTCSIACGFGFGNCDGIAANGCEIDMISDPKNCGGCGKVCAVGLSCSDGGCACPGVQGMDCGGTCVDLASDAKNCGACGHDCQPTACMNSVCGCTYSCADLITGSATEFCTKAPAASQAAWKALVDCLCLPANCGMECALSCAMQPETNANCSPCEAAAASAGCSTETNACAAN